MNQQGNNINRCGGYGPMGRSINMMHTHPYSNSLFPPPPPPIFANTPNPPLPPPCPPPGQFDPPHTHPHAALATIHSPTSPPPAFPTTPSPTQHQHNKRAAPQQWIHFHTYCLQSRQNFASHKHIGIHAMSSDWTYLRTFDRRHTPPATKQPACLPPSCHCSSDTLGILMGFDTWRTATTCTWSSPRTLRKLPSSPSSWWECAAENWT